MIILKSKIKTFIKVPGEFFRYRSKFLRKFYHFLSKYLHFKTYHLRKLNNNFHIGTKALPDFIDQKVGYKRYSKKTLEKWNIEIDDLIINIKKKLSSINLDEINKKDENIIKLFSSKDYNCSSSEFKFVSNENLLKIISEYLGSVPLLTHISLWYSPNSKSHDGSSQIYHLDHEDFKQVKGFLYIYDVDENSGPLNIINAYQSNFIQKKINYRLNENSKRVSDETIKKLKAKNLVIDEVIMSGESGDLVLVDTSNCFHFGSRLASKPRFVLAFQYITPYAFTINWNWQKYGGLYHKFCKKFDNKLIERITGKII